MATKKMYAYWCYQLMEGDTYIIDSMMEQMKKDGFIDEYDEWIYEEDEE